MREARLFVLPPPPTLIYMYESLVHIHKHHDTLLNNNTATSLCTKPKLALSLKAAESLEKKLSLSFVFSLSLSVHARTLPALLLFAPLPRLSLNRPLGQSVLDT
jgi:hypothetical protein